MPEVQSVTLSASEVRFLLRVLIELDKRRLNEFDKPVARELIAKLRGRNDDNDA